MLDCCNSSSSCPSAALSNSVHEVEGVDGRDWLPKVAANAATKALQIAGCSLKYWRIVLSSLCNQSST